MPDDSKRWPHFLIQGFTTTDQFKPPSGGPKRKPVPARDRESHGSALLAQLRALNQPVLPTGQTLEQPEGLDLQVEFEGWPDVELAFESLARERSGIQLLNVRREDNKTLATVFVPAGKLVIFEGLLEAYLEKKTDKSGRPRDNRYLVDAIHAIRRAGVRALWTDDPSAFPETKTESLWWEVWLALPADDQEGIALFRDLAAEQGIRLSGGVLKFPERVVLLARGSLAQMESSMLMLNSIAELRRAKETADLFESMALSEQMDWVDELLKRVELGEPASAPHICLLDTGVNRGHPLLEAAVDSADLHSVEPAWGTNDTHGHGTQMAGLALYGDLTPLFASNEPVRLGHRLESVKLLPTEGANEGDARHHGYLTTEAVSRPEVTAPHRRRVFGMAITARDRRDRGRPSAWSAAVDRLASDADNEAQNPRLIILSAGNVDDAFAWGQYPSSSDTSSIQDPGQAWNALTVGAATNLTTITDDGDLVPIAPAGGLSPFSSTSFTWERQWPLKPDVLFEGGNAAKDSLSAVTVGSLSLLTTHHQPHDLLFATALATSAAMANATRMAAILINEYPSLWPETIRGLILHSAEWTPNMRAQYLPGGQGSKAEYINLIRRCGFGIPDLERSLWTVSNSLTLIAQESMRPFKREPGKDVSARELHLHDLPWPAAGLQDLGSAIVDLRITLSYFIEPNPSARGVKSKYSYQSHGFRFDVIRPTESRPQFEKRVNAAARALDEELQDAPEDAGWVIGKQGRSRGSIHSDIWRGPAAELASRNVIAVFPSGGWWKTRPTLGRYDSVARYSLIISISAPTTDIDLVTEVANQIGVPISIET